MLESLAKGNESVMRVKAVETRLRLLGRDAPNSRNERAEGLCGACASDTPSGDGRWAVCDRQLLPERRKRRCTLPLSLAGSDAARGGCSEERLPLAAD